MKEFNGFVSPICFPNVPGLKEENLDAIVAGWGRDENGKYGLNLRKANVTILPPDTCEAILSYTGFRGVLYCALDKTGNGGGVCRGDSGGPLFHYNPTTLRYEVLAIVQGGEMWGVTPDVYTDVNDQNIRSWILGGISLSLNLSY